MWFDLFILCSTVVWVARRLVADVVEVGEVNDLVTVLMFELFPEVLS